MEYGLPVGSGLWTTSTVAALPAPASTMFRCPHYSVTGPIKRVESPCGCSMQVVAVFGKPVTPEQLQRIVPLEED